MFAPALRLGLVLMVAAVLPTPARNAAQAGEQVEVESIEMQLALPGLESLARNDRPIGDLIAAWTGTMGPSEVRIEVGAFDPKPFDATEPEEVSALCEGYHTQRLEQARLDVRFQARKVVQGSFGWLPYASLVQADLRRGTGVDGKLWVLCGLRSDKAWVVSVEAHPLPTVQDRARIEAFLREGVRVGGPARDSVWSDEEARAMWRAWAPPDALDKLEPPLRTAHYLILTNSGGGKKFGQKMEESYTAIQKVFPFEEVAARRQMPVFLFRTPQQYYAFFSKRTGISLGKAERSKGHAYEDYYATWYDAPGDPVHVHEATHQIFRNRLHLSGGGSWFQEGVAEYMSTSENDRNNAARLAKKERHTPLKEFFAIESLLMSAGQDIKGGSESSDHYKQAALLIEFLRESPFGKERFQELVHAIGKVPRNDLTAIGVELGRVCAVSIEGLDHEFVAYCKKR